MRITIDERPGATGIEVTIVCGKTDRQVLDIVARLRMFDRKVTGSMDGSTHVVNAEDILYVESVDKRTFFYTESAVFETPLRLYLGSDAIAAVTGALNARLDELQKWAEVSKTTDFDA